MSENFQEKKLCEPLAGIPVTVKILYYVSLIKHIDFSDSMQKKKYAPSILCNVMFIYIYWNAAIPFMFVQCISKVCRVESVQRCIIL